MSTSNSSLASLNRSRAVVERDLVLPATVIILAYELWDRNAPFFPRLATPGVRASATATPSGGRAGRGGSS